MKPWKKSIALKRAKGEAMIKTLSVRIIEGYYLVTIDRYCELGFISKSICKRFNKFSDACTYFEKA